MERSNQHSTIKDGKENEGNKQKSFKPIFINDSMNSHPILLSINIKNNLKGTVDYSAMNPKDSKIISVKTVKPGGKTLISNSSVKNIGIMFDPIDMNFKNMEKTQLIHNNTAKKPLKVKEQVAKVKISLSNLQKVLNQKTSLKQLDSNKRQTIRINNSGSKKFLATTCSAPKNKHNQSSTNKSNLCRNSSTIFNLKDQFPLTAIQTLKLFGKELSDFEKGEILDYDKIYYMGNGIAKLNMDKVTGYDDEKSDYNTYVGEQINYRYEILDILGKGSFGQALKCIDHKTQQIVAVKIIRSKKKFYHQATIEAKILKYIKDNDIEDRANVIKILDSFMFRKHIVTFFIILVYCY